MSRISNMAAVPVLALGLMVAGFGSDAVGQSILAKPSKDVDSVEKKQKAMEIAKAVAASFYFASTILFILLSIRFFTWKQKVRLPII